MPILQLKFEIRLKNNRFTYTHSGPLFHRWLPNGKKDAIPLDTGEKNNKLMVWFERFGYVDDSFICFDLKRREVDPTIIPKQGILKAGPLFGLLEVQKTSKKAVQALSNNDIGNTLYVKLGKVIVKTIYPPVANFLNIFSINFGQYWIRSIEKWDSREASLGSYCRELNLKWRLKGNRKWSPFIPDKPTSGPLIFKSRVFESFPEVPTKADWQELFKEVEKGYKPTFAGSILARSHQFIDQGNLRHAFIEGVLAFELAIEEFGRRKLKKSNNLFGDIKNSFNKLGMKEKVVIVSTFLGNIPSKDIENAVEAVDIRNKIVHDGDHPSEGDELKLYKLLKITASLLEGPKHKFPHINPGNALMSLEHWDKKSKRI